MPLSKARNKERMRQLRLHKERVVQPELEIVQPENLIEKIEHNGLIITLKFPDEAALQTFRLLKSTDEPFEIL